MGDLKSVASLTSGLLARKGRARPAMRPQIAAAAQGPQAVVTDADEDDGLDTDLAVAQAELGWNDHGEQVAHEAETGDLPEVLRQREDLEASVAANDADEEDRAASAGAPHAAPVKLTPMGTPAERPAQRVRAEIVRDRRAAFTLRVDNERHLRLRLACTLQNRSAQQVVTEALDRLLDEMPGLADLARRARRH